MSRKPQQESSYTETSTYRVRPRRRVKIHLEPDLHDSLKDYSHAHGVSMAAIIRAALEYAMRDASVCTGTTARLRPAHSPDYAEALREGGN